MPRVPIGLGLQSYRNSSLPVSAQRCVNWFAEQAPAGASTQVALMPTPGLSLFSTCGDGPVRGLHTAKGVLYAVSGRKLYSVGADGTATERGTIPRQGPVSVTDNGTQVVIVTDDGEGYVYNIAAASLSQITNASWRPARAAAFLDQYVIFSERDSGRFFISALGDAASFDALDFATAESAPDDTLTLIVDHRELWLFGQTTIEVWANTGAADFPFSRISTGIIERGCGAARSVAKLDNSVFWLGDDGAVYRAEGYSPLRISTHAIEYALSRYETTADAIAFAHNDRGHPFYVLTFPRANATWVYDVATGYWHERYSGTEPDCAGRWRANCHAFAYGGHIVGDFENGKLYRLDGDAATEDGAAIRRMSDSPYIEDDGKRLMVHGFELMMEVGVGLPSGQGSDPLVTLSWSDDGGRTWGNEISRSFGRIGAYETRVRWHRLGQTRKRIFRVATSEPVKPVILKSYADMNAGLN